MSRETTTLGVDDSLFESAARCLDTSSVRALPDIVVGLSVGRIRAEWGETGDKPDFAGTSRLCAKTPASH
jgi:hypothetical protein